MFGEKLKSLRESKNLLQKELADVLNTTSQTISGWEISRTKPDYDTLVKIANYFNVSTDYLLGNDVNATKFENELKEREALYKALVNGGYINDGEDLTNEELKNLIEFVKTNKKYIKDIK